ncbi:MAG: regulatory protein, partial [Pseudonocardiales bacterium]|nr:regulatory protein [Pseudonocardiales bacterium]
MTARSRGRAADRRQPVNGGDEPPPDDEDQSPGDPEDVARAICLRLLTQRSRSRAELAKALTARGIPAHAARSVLDRFVEVGLIDDSALAAQ